MKTKILLFSSIVLTAFAFLSSQSLDSYVNYSAISKANTKHYRAKSTETVTACTKCHDCGTDGQMASDTLTTNLKENDNIDFKLQSLLLTEKRSEEMIPRNDSENIK